MVLVRDAYLQMEPNLHDNEIIVIHGSRQVGKSSLMEYIQEVIARDNQTLFLDLEEPANLVLCNQGVESVMKYLASINLNLTRKVYLFIDEIQYLDNPSSFLKLFHDKYKGQVKLIVSGSSTFAIKSKFKDSLVGRTSPFELFPLDFAEFLLFKGENINLDADISEILIPKLKLLFAEFCIYGGYPAIVLENSTMKKEKKLQQIISTYVKADIRDLGNIRDIQKFNNFIRILSSQTGGQLNISELSRTVGISMPTVEEYLFMLENTYIIRRVYPFFQNVRSELSKMPKIFFEDTGLVNLMENLRFSSKVTVEMFENAVFSEIRKVISLENLKYWRTNKQQEIDFIINGENLMPIEVKLNLTSFTGLSSLKYFHDNYKTSKAYVVSLSKPKETSEFIEVLYPWEVKKLLK